MAVGESITCTATGTAIAGQYTNNSDVVGTDPVGTDVTDEDPSNYFGSDPAIDIEKATNTVDADVAPGVQLAAGDAVTWTYVVTNTGNSDLVDVVVTDDIEGAITCPQDALAVGESMTCTATGTAIAGQYTNNSDVVGTDPVGTDVTDEDPSNYFGGAPAIDIEKATNAVDADVAPGPSIAIGDAVTWTYVVTNTGNVDLVDVVVTDDIEGVITCPQDTLAVGESITCTATGIATAGQYTNNSDVVGTDPFGADVTDEDPSNYFGVESGIDLEKATNTVDADAAPGVELSVGDAVTWTYVVTNTGNATLSSIVLTDDVEGAITCPQDTLAVGESMTCTCLLYTSPSPRDATLSRMPSSA